MDCLSAPGHGLGSILGSIEDAGNLAMRPRSWCIVTDTAISAAELRELKLFSAPDAVHRCQGLSRGRVLCPALAEMSTDFQDPPMQKKRSLHCVLQLIRQVVNRLEYLQVPDARNDIVRTVSGDLLSARNVEPAGEHERIPWPVVIRTHETMRWSAICLQCHRDLSTFAAAACAPGLDRNHFTNGHSHSMAANRPLHVASAASQLLGSKDDDEFGCPLIPGSVQGYMRGIF